MSTFSEALGVLLYPFAVVAFASFLVWCFLSLFRQGARFRKSRLFVGFFFLFGPFIPVLKIVPLFPFLTFGNAGMAVAQFPATLPKYIANLDTWLREDATVQEIEYVLEIHGRRYAPKMEIACSTRRFVTLDKGVGELQSWTSPAIGNNVFFGKAGDDLVAIHLVGSSCNSDKAAPHARIVVLRGIDDVLSAKKAFVEIADFDYQGKPIELFQVSIKGASLGRRTTASARSVIPLRELIPYQDGSPGSPRIYGAFPGIFQRVRGDAIWGCAEIAILQFDSIARRLRPGVYRLNYDLSGPLTPAQERCRQEAARVLKAVPWKEIPEQK